MALSRVTAPTAQPVTLPELKAYMRLTHSDSDVELQGLIEAATELLEAQTYRQIVTATWERRLDRFPANGVAIKLPRPPLAAVTSLQYVDPDGVVQTWAASNYVVSNRTVYGELWTAHDVSWPDIRYEREAVRITFTAGQARASVPERIKTAVKAIAMQMHDYPGEATVGAAVMELASTRRLIDSLRLPDIGDSW